MKKITVLVPAYNEENVIMDFYDELNSRIQSLFVTYNFELLFVNDGSGDKTLDKIAEIRKIDSRCCYIDLSRNFGKENAMLAGMDYATGDCVIIMDCDLQDPPSIIPDMLKYWEEGYDDVYAMRINRGKESALRKFLTKKYYNLLQKICNFNILPNVGDFRLLDRKCVEAIKRMREQERYSKGLFAWIGFRKKALHFNRNDRANGKSHFSFVKLFGLAINGITSFSNFPLRIVIFSGIVIAAAAFVYSAYFFVKTLCFGEQVQGFPTLIIVILLLGGMQLTAIGIVGEYVGRIFNESKRRPVYLVREYCGNKNIQ